MLLFKSKMQQALVAFATAVALSLYFLKKNAKKRLGQLPPNKERVMIIGCSSGIGRDIALQYAARHAQLSLFARRLPLLEDLRNECEKAGSRNVVTVAGDVAQTTDLELLVQTTKRQLGGIDTVIFCAGLISVRPFMEASGIQVDQSTKTVQVDETTSIDEALEHITNVNYMAPVRLARLVLPTLIVSSVAPNIIIMSSLAGKVGAPTRALYAGSKHALHGFFDSLRVEVEAYNVHVGIVCPGTVNTELRNTAVDMSSGSGPAAGSTRGKLTAAVVAQRTIAASDRREREVFIPAFMGYAAIWAKLIASSWVDWAAKRKYSQ